MSSADPAVTVIPATRTPVVPISFVCAEFGSNEETPTVAEPIERVALIVCAVPVIGSDPETVADVLTATTLRPTTCPALVLLSATMLPATVKVRVWPAATVTFSPMFV